MGVRDCWIGGRGISRFARFGLDGSGSLGLDGFGWILGHGSWEFWFCCKRLRFMRMGLSMAGYDLHYLINI